MIKIKSVSGKRKDQKILLHNIANFLLEKNLHLDRAEVSGKKIIMHCAKEKQVFSLLEKIRGIEEIVFNEKEIEGKGGLPKGSRGGVLLDKKKYKEPAQKMGFEIVEKDFDAVVTDNVKKFKKKGVLAFDFSYCSIL